MSDENELKIANALTAYHDRNEPKIKPLAREFGVSYQTLLGRIRGAGSASGRLATNKALDSVQEKALLDWIIFMDSCGAPPTALSIQHSADDIIHRSDPDRKPLWHGWGLAFTKRLPKLAPHLHFIKQKPKDPKRMGAEDVGLTEMWYDRLEQCIKQYGFRPKDIYNMDETGFRIGEGKAQKVVSASPISFTATGGHSESITAIECIAADDWKTPPWFLVKAQYHQECWYIDEMPDDWTIKPTPKGYSSYTTALEWLDSFIEATNHRVYRHKYAESDDELAEARGHGGRRRYGQDAAIRQEIKAIREEEDRVHCRGYRLLLFDGHKSHCRFFREIVKVREGMDALSEHVIKEGFRLTGIVPIDAQLAMEQEIRDANDETNDIWLDGFPDRDGDAAQDRELASSITMSPPRDVLDTKSTSQKLLNDIADARRRLATLKRTATSIRKRNNESAKERNHRENGERRRLKSFLSIVERVLHRSTLICSTAGNSTEGLAQFRADNQLLLTHTHNRTTRPSGRQIRIVGPLTKGDANKDIRKRELKERDQAEKKAISLANKAAKNPMPAELLARGNASLNTPAPPLPMSPLPMPESSPSRKRGMWR
ncbi:uncharacterized protein N7446_012658 [Penicillium canescens]|uniref:HTH CENPB-type domain-containing protein n=1 Tax=Penicillium canescens TaxID=5083 RepID=A0AAD6IA92_PENCN|nr:uncharacterized protein N7446_012658 [Penicillium canescens]KAJ6038846.1 hypothetical protein N7460_007563 [Penicillium canescens]KAJ6045794.1 hypothetical protein N7446_012658 [Penicillium canescens]KAJ6066379.1 hypothetical protein N7444_000132 [Penicillium canescens]